MESELVSGFMTEHSAVIFVFFFLAEYASIVLICILASILFLGGYLNFLSLDILFDKDILLNIYLLSHWTNFEDVSYITLRYYDEINYLKKLIEVSKEGFLPSLNLALKTSILIFVFIWTRASFPRIRFDQLMSVCWTVLLPIVIGYIVLIPCIVFGLGILPINISLL